MNDNDYDYRVSYVITYRTKIVDAEATDEDTLEFELNIKCKLPKDAAKDDKKAYIDSKVLSKHLKWLPIGNQASKVYIK